MSGKAREGKSGHVTTSTLAPLLHCCNLINFMPTQFKRKRQSTVIKTSYETTEVAIQSELVPVTLKYTDHAREVAA